MAAAIDSDNSDHIPIAFVHSGTIVAFLVTVPATLGPILDDLKASRNRFGNFYFPMKNHDLEDFWKIHKNP